MAEILVTPKGGSVIADPATRTIICPPWGEMVPVGAKIARAKGADRIGPKDLEFRVEALFKHSQKVDLSEGGQLRFGAGFVTYDRNQNGRPWFGKYDAGHPTRPNFLTPASGLVEKLDPAATAKDELSQEFVIRTSSAVGRWSFKGELLSDLRPKEYAQEFGLSYDSSLVVNLDEVVTPFHWKVFFGEEAHDFLVEFEPDTSSIELLLTGEMALPVSCQLVDGERLPDGKWRNQPVTCGHPLTSKAALALFVADELAKQSKSVG